MIKAIEQIEADIIKLRRALLVFTLTPTISNWLEIHDPKALKQAQRALEDTA